ncbi:MAG TPA: DUF1614 domain-containing protein [Clostridiales bacterium]|nr:DUF1614 domain-containing protein [Clostridiales bacterium]
MPFGLMLLVIISVLIVFGIAHQVLDRMRLSDKAVLLIIGGMIAGTLLPNIPITDNFSINIGGAIIPIALCVYLFVKAGTAEEKSRAIASTIIAATAVFLAGRLLPSEPQTTIMDPNYVYGILAGVTAYLFGRSRRSAFIAGVMGVILADIAQGVMNVIAGVPGPIRLGAAGIVDAVVISGLIAVILAEVTGEFREKLQGGTVHKDKHFRNAEFTSSLGTSGNKSVPVNERGGCPKHGSGQDGQPIGGMGKGRPDQRSGEGGQPEHRSGQDGQPIGGMDKERSHQGSGKKDNAGSDQNQVQAGDSGNEKKE